MFDQSDRTIDAQAVRTFPWVIPHRVSIKDKLLIFQLGNEFLSIEYFKYALGQRWCDLDEKDKLRFQGIWDATDYWDHSVFLYVYIDSEGHYNELTENQKERFHEFVSKEEISKLRHIFDMCPWLDGYNLTQGDKLLLFQLNQN